MTGEAAPGPTRPLGVAVVGAGYWGPNLIRNFRSSTDWDLVAVCDLDVARAHTVLGTRSGVAVTASLDEVLARDDVDAIAIATPARTHQGVALAALRAGKHVLVEKPLADSVANGTAMVELARERGLVLMADHTYCYTPAVLKIRELVEAGELGDILFIDSVRINLGLVQPDVDVFWDLAPTTSPSWTSSSPGASSPPGWRRRAPTRSGPARAASATSASRWWVARWRTSTSTGSAPPRSGRW
ncbi:Gfo/Idh/MocA family protein [Nocardioides houyundeii]|uniref:Gfo/Idh/MocA family protein n=1 Tax=Nocardioides houyundeii TaxID=2045452 RepID=UPI0018EFB12F|nr:Gfo/Idh/MocA family oxidoreductase [Nocardioides houyundeii]